MKTGQFIFSKKSLSQLDTIHEQLRRVIHVALGFGIIDFTVLEGARTDERQEELFLDGKTKLHAGQSKHNVGPISGRTTAEAVDLVPVNPVDWGDRERFAVLAGVMFCAAKIVGVELRWGGDWDGDTQTRDETFRDMGHFELVL